MDSRHGGRHPGRVRQSKESRPTLQTLVDRRISELRKELGKARRADRSNRTKLTKAARRDLRRAIRRAKKACWNIFLESANREDVWTAVRCINPRPDDSARPFINGDTTAITRREKEMMLIEAAFPEPPADNGSPYRQTAPHTTQSIQRSSVASSPGARTRAPQGRTV